MVPRLLALGAAHGPAALIAEFGPGGRVQTVQSRRPFDSGRRDRRAHSRPGRRKRWSWISRPRSPGRWPTTATPPSPAPRRDIIEEAAVAAIDSARRLLRLPTIRARFADIAADSQREQLSYLGFLAELVMVECDDRDKRASARRIAAAGFPRTKILADFDFAQTRRSPPR